MKKNVRIYETLNSALTLKRELTDKGLRLSGVFGVCGKRNNNNRVYEKKNYGKMVQLLQEEIAQNHGVPGELEHPNTMNINLNNVSHKIESIQMNEDGTVTGTILLLNTDKGRQAQAIVEGGLDLYISSRASGNIDASGNVILETLKTYDLVGTPGFSEARLSLCESKNDRVEMVTENLCYVYEADDDDDDDVEETKEETKNENNENVMKEILKRLDAIEAKLDCKCDKDEVKECYDWVKNEFANGVQKWITEEYTPNMQNKFAGKIEKWITEEYTPATQDKLADGIQRWITEEYTPCIENWVVEQYTPEIENWITEEYSTVTEKYLVEHFAPEIEKWVNEEFTPSFASNVEGWVVEHFAPEIQKWITEEYGTETTKNIAEGVQGWIQEELMPHMDKWINEELCPEIYNNVNDYIMESKKTSIDTIDAMLDMVESSGTGVIDNMVTESKNDFEGNYVLESMPDAYKPLWNMCNEEKKADILNRAKLYDFLKEGTADKFWASVDFTAPVATTTQVNENYSNYQRNVLAGIRRLRRF